MGGSETSASTLTNAMLFLGLHPSVWNQLVEEQRELQKIHGDALTPSVLEPTLAPYLDALLKETLRMRTVVGGIPRKTLEDIEIEGVTIPKGWLIDPSMLLTHEEDPATKLPNGEHLDAIKGFRPERWLSKKKKKNDAAAASENDDGSDKVVVTEYDKPSSDWYVPYGFGYRHCLGRNLAQLEMKIFLATMARKINMPRLDMIPSEDYYEDVDAQYFPVEWSTKYAVIPTPADGALATVTSSAAPIGKAVPTTSSGADNEEDHRRHDRSNNNINSVNGEDGLQHEIINAIRHDKRNGVVHNDAHNATVLSEKLN